jgi:protein-tyrosine phosphatase
MIDLHSHILFDIDDGPPDLAGSLALAHAAVADGITLMACTPHARLAYLQARDRVALIHERIATLRTTFADEGIALELIPGMEIYAEPESVDLLRQGRLLTYGESRTVLVEFPANVLMNTFEQMLFVFQLAGYRVLVAHPERIQAVRQNPQLLKPLIERGIFFQLTAEALLGTQGERMQQLATTLVQQGLVQVLASDSHGSHLDRMPVLRPAVARAAELIGLDAARAMVEATPAALLAVPPTRP